MIRSLFYQLSYRTEQALRRLCGRLTPGKRLAVIVTMLIFFSALSLFITIYSIYSIGKKNGEMLQIDHIDQLELQLKQDSLQHIKEKAYGSDTRG